MGIDDPWALGIRPGLQGSAERRAAIAAAMAAAGYGASDRGPAGRGKRSLD